MFSINMLEVYNNHEFAIFFTLYIQQRLLIGSLRSLHNRKPKPKPKPTVGFKFENRTALHKIKG